MEFPKIFRKKESAPPAPVLPPAVFNETEMKAYENAAQNDEKLADLLTGLDEIVSYQVSGQGVHEDAQRREQLESLIANRYRELQQNAVR